MNLQKLEKRKMRSSVRPAKLCTARETQQARERRTEREREREGAGGREGGAETAARTGRTKSKKRPSVRATKSFTLRSKSMEVNS